MTETPHDSVRVSLNQKIGWGIGSLGAGLVLNIQVIFFVKYAIDYVGLAPALVGGLILVAKLFDLATDLPMGMISDRTQTRWGRRRPYVLLGGLMAGLVFAAMFNIPALDGNTLSAWTFSVLVLMAVAYTVFAVPYIAVPSEVTNDSNERSSMMSWRVMFSMVATTAGAWLAGQLIDGFGGGREGFGAMGMVIGGIIAGCAVITFFSIESQPRVHSSGIKKQSVSLASQIQTIVSNQPFMILLSVKFLQLLSFASNITLQVFFFVNVLGISFSTYGVLALWKGLATVVSTPLWVAVSKRIGKRATYIIATLGQALVNLSWFYAEAGQPLEYSVFRLVLIGFFTSGIILMGLSMLTDTIEFDRRRTGLQREGVMSSLYTSIEKLAFAVAPALAALYLQFSGYVAGGGGTAVQPEAAINAIYLMLSVVPASLSLLSLVGLAFYRLDQQQLKSGDSVPGVR